MSLQDLVSVVRTIEQDGGLIRIFPRDYAVRFWENVGRDIRFAYDKLDPDRKEQFQQNYLSFEQREVFPHTLQWMDWVYRQLNKALFKKCTANLIPKTRIDSIWDEYSHDRYYDVLWLLTVALPPQAVQRLKQEYNQY